MTDRAPADPEHEALAASLPVEWVKAAESWYSMHGSGLVRNILAGAVPLIEAPLREHIDADHAVMVKLGRLADAAVRMLEHVNMDTDKDRELHARAVGALRGGLDDLAARMKAANDADRASAEARSSSSDEMPGQDPLPGVPS